MAMAIRPDNIGFESTQDGLIISFSADSGEMCAVALTRAQAAMLLNRLMKETESDRVVPIDRGSLTVGQTFVPQGCYVQKNTDGRRRLVVTVRLDNSGRIVEIPLELSRADASSLSEELE
jgi:hypothetical protein